MSTDSLSNDLDIHDHDDSDHMIQHQNHSHVDTENHMTDEPAMNLVTHDPNLQLGELTIPHHHMHEHMQHMEVHQQGVVAVQVTSEDSLVSVVMQPSHVQQAHMMSASNAAAAAAAVSDHMATSDANAHFHQQSAHHQHMLPNSPSQGMSKTKRVQTRRSWTPEEDKQLLDLVKADGTNCWSQIATHLEGRVGKQCRERWRNHLDPNIRRDSFSPEEDDHILELVQELGTRWSKIAQRLPGRTENAVKNRYHCFLKNRDSTGKRPRDDKNNPSMILQKHKRLQGDKGIFNFSDPDSINGKASPEGNFSCNLLGCGKHFSHLSHLLAHRLTHFAEGRHPSSQAVQLVEPVSSSAPVPIPGDTTQQPANTPAETVMLVRALDGLVDDLLSQIHPRAQEPQGNTLQKSSLDDHHNALADSQQQQHQQQQQHHEIKSEQSPNKMQDDGSLEQSNAMLEHHQNQMAAMHAPYTSEQMDQSALHHTHHTHHHHHHHHHADEYVVVNDNIKTE